MADLPANTPVLVGVAAVQQKLDDYEQALEPVALMAQALRDAAADAGSEALLQRADEIAVPKSMWSYADPGRYLADAFGAHNATTVLADFGITQQSFFTRACRRIQSGEIAIALVAGGEARYRALCAAKAGGEAPETAQPGIEPDVFLVPDAELFSEVENASGLGMPVGFYAIMDSALRHKQGLSVDAHRDQMAQLYAHYSEIAAANPDAWADEAVSAGFIREHSAKNRMLAFPYTKLHNSQWNVDQAAGLVFCSVAVAEELGIPRDKWVFPRVSAESNFMSVVASREDLGGSPGFRHAGEAAMRLAGVNFDEVRFRELYSCFPYAVRVQLEEFGMDPAGEVSVTGGMTFGGGPLNNFVFQATVKMAQILRDHPGELGLVTTVSGVVTKQACALWSTEPGGQGWQHEDVTEQVRADTRLCEVVGDYAGPGTVAGYTVLYQGDDPWRGIAVFDLPHGKRTVAFSEDAAQMQRMMTLDCIGDRCELSGGQFTLAAG